MYISFGTFFAIILAIYLINAWNDAGRNPSISRAYGERERKRAAKAAAKAEAMAECLAKTRAANARYYTKVAALKAPQGAAPDRARP